LSWANNSFAIVAYPRQLFAAGAITDLLTSGDVVANPADAHKSVRIRRLLIFFITLMTLGVFVLYLLLAPCNQMDLVNATACSATKPPDGPPPAVSLLGSKGQLCWFYVDRAHQTKVRLAGMLFANPEAEDVVLVSHGKGGSVNSVPYDFRMQSVYKQGHSLFFYDYSGYGHSEGKATYAGLQEDGLAAYDYLVQQMHFKPSQVVLYGISLGGAVTGAIAARRPSKAVIIDSSFASTEYYVKEVVPFMKIYPGFLYPRPDYNNMTLFQAPHAPLLIIHGAADKMIPKDNALILKRLASPPAVLVMLPHSGHAGLARQDQKVFFDGLNNFFASLKGSAAISKL
jgi:pimeloyl-ACP methyl ester carboxylesterase